MGAQVWQSEGEEVDTMTRNTEGEEVATLTSQVVELTGQLAILQHKERHAVLPDCFIAIPSSLIAPQRSSSFFIEIRPEDVKMNSNT